MLLAATTPNALNEKQEPELTKLAFSAYTPLASGPALAERVLAPLTRAAVLARLASDHAVPRDQLIDLAKERFGVYVPPIQPAAGYALMVFIAPWNDARLPSGWESPLEKHGMIFVSPANAGNDASAFERRMPLAILAAFNIMQRFRVDPDRVYAAGFSGGSRVALRLALAYPDLFRGAFLDAGADPIGERTLPLPSRALFSRFETGSRLVFLTGARDEDNVRNQSDSVASLKRWCVAGASQRIYQELDHAIAPQAGLDWAIPVLDRPVAAQADTVVNCRLKRESDLNRRLETVRAAVAVGDRTHAGKLLTAIDDDYGGLAAPASAAQFDALRSSRQ